jgi:predicted DsbA family dithiol-disulfide isomerase
MSKIAIEVYSDIVCPWCLIGSRKLERALAALDADIEVDVEQRPMILDPTIPPGGRDVRAMIRAKTGQDAESVWAYVESEARAVGIDLILARQPFIYPTAAALTLVRMARERGTQNALARALIDAYFLDHLDISNVGILGELASRHGFLHTEAERLAGDSVEISRTVALSEQARARGIRTVPSYVIGGRLLPAGQDIERALPSAVSAARSQRIAAR